MDNYRIGTSRDDSIVVYACSVLHAFHLARLQRYGSATLHCFGIVRDS